uniref:Uncharacterized protein n=1 Tax=Panagrolaimus sp. PS1159 TaxID=55785 RepID=A0AC35GGF5_9BILA
MLCRIVTLDELSHGSTVMLQLQWYGVDFYTNDTESRWHIGRMEKICSPYVQKLEYSFLLEKADRYQLILSAVKQIRVIDLLDGLPAISISYKIRPNFYVIIVFIVLHFYNKIF